MLQAAKADVAGQESAPVSAFIESSSQETTQVSAGDSRAPRRSMRKFLELDDLVTETAASIAESLPRSSTHTSLLSALSPADGKARRRKGRARTLVKSRAFNLAIAAAILVNGIYIGFETELAPRSQPLLVPWFPLEVIFTVVFLAELCLRYAASRDCREFGLNCWHIFDFVLVTLSCVDTFILSFVSRNTDELGMLDAIRIVRLARVVRLFRLFRFFPSLWVLVAGIIEAMYTLIWTWLLMGLIVYICGIFATRTLGQPHEDDSDMVEFFGSVSKSMFTLFQVTTTEAWGGIARAAMKHEPWSAIFFIAYISVTSFAVMNVVIAVIVEYTLDQAGTQRRKFMEKKKEEHNEACVKIYEVFKDADTNGDGVMTKQEFLREIDNQEVRRYFTQLGIDLRQAENLFSILDYDDSGNLDAHEFVGGVMKAIGVARAKDILALECDSMRSERKVERKLGSVRREAEQAMEAVEQGMAKLRQDVRTIARACGAVASAASSAPGQRISSPGSPGLPGLQAGASRPRIASLQSPRSPGNLF